MTRSVYVASPLGFSEPTRSWYAGVLLPAVQAVGLEPLDPWSAGTEILQALSWPPGPERTAMLVDANRVTGARNAQMIDQAHGLLAVLDGVDVDSGTAAEIGYAAALGKPCIGWRSDVRQTGDNEGATVNLQVEHFLAAPVQRDLAAALELLAGLVA